MKSHEARPTPPGLLPEEVERAEKRGPVTKEGKPER